MNIELEALNSSVNCVVLLIVVVPEELRRQGTQKRRESYLMGLRAWLESCGLRGDRLVSCLKWMNS